MAGRVAWPGRQLESCSARSVPSWSRKYIGEQWRSHHHRPIFWSDNAARSHKVYKTQSDYHSTNSRHGVKKSLASTSTATGSLQLLTSVVLSLFSRAKTFKPFDLSWRKLLRSKSLALGTEEVLWHNNYFFPCLLRQSIFWLSRMVHILPVAWHQIEFPSRPSGQLVIFICCPFFNDYHNCTTKVKTNTVPQYGHWLESTWLRFIWVKAKPTHTHTNIEWQKS